LYLGRSPLDGFLEPLRGLPLDRLIHFLDRDGPIPGEVVEQTGQPSERIPSLWPSHKVALIVESEDQAVARLQT
jgi:hypothetical protein